MGLIYVTYYNVKINVASTEVGRRSSAATGDAHEKAFLFQRISVSLQRFNALLVPDVEPDL